MHLPDKADTRRPIRRTACSPENSLKAPSPSSEGSATLVEPRGGRTVARSYTAYWDEGVKKSRKCCLVFGEHLRRFELSRRLAIREERMVTQSHAEGGSVKRRGSQMKGIVATTGP